MTRLFHSDQSTNETFWWYRSNYLQVSGGQIKNIGYS